MKKPSILSFYNFIFFALLLSSCADDDGPATPTTWDIGNPEAMEYTEDYYAGGLLGTTSVNSSTSFKQPTKVVEY